MSPILVTPNDSNFESSNFSLKENKPDGVNPNSNYIDYYVRKNEGKILWFSADCNGSFPDFMMRKTRCTLQRMLIYGKELFLLEKS